MGLRFLNVATFFLALISHQVWSQTENDFIKKADHQFKLNKYKDALDNYEKAYALNPDNLKTNYQIGILYLEGNYKFKSLPYLEKVLNEEKNPEPIFYRYLGLAYHFAHRFDEAEVNYKKYGSLSPMLDEVDKAWLSRKIEECNNGRLYISQKRNLEIVNLGEQINSPYPDYAPIISTNESCMIFTSRRKECVGGELDENDDYYEDIFISYKKDGIWQKAKSVGDNINTPYNEAGIGFSKTGKEIYIYEHDGDGDIYYSMFNPDSSLTDPQPIKGKVNGKHTFESAATVSSNGKRLFFTSDRPDGFGAEDIYYADILPDGSWGKPMNMGEKINTPESEEGPFLDFDDKTLYFSSTAHKGMGGYDIYKTVFDSTTKTWSTPVNMGYPVNSADDDLFFTLSGDGSHGYFSSVKPNGFGEKDIYMIVMPPRNDREELLEKMRAMNLIVRTTKRSDADSNTYELQISIKDEETGEILDAELLLSSKEFTDRSPSNKNDSSYLYNVSSKKEQRYTLIVKKKGFAFATVNFILSQYNGKMQEVKIPIKMARAKPGTIVQLRNIYYDFNQYVLRETSYPSLNNLLEFLKENPQVKVEIRSHTDSKGSASYNLALSQKRAQSVVNFLKANGINSKRIKAKGYGEGLPLVSNDDEEEGRELNRRTEFKIIK
ncbi:MAG TPA: OmpA family protein [Cytophagaceae bacterium]|jgi:outer membrane protein OmpA-like peptidoglycan-associated protein/tetratricopeptide (TPR) repeat protein|nr:OmpA family protein [Cytophagaceae bacterium]